MLDGSQIEMETGKHRDKRTERDDIEGRRRRLKHEQVKQKEQDKGGRKETRGQFRIKTFFCWSQLESKVVNFSAPLF